MRKTRHEITKSRHTLRGLGLRGLGDIDDAAIEEEDA